jgi:hypothetical protein
MFPPERVPKVLLLISRQIHRQDLCDKICESGYNQQIDAEQALSFATVLRQASGSH